MLENSRLLKDSWLRWGAETKEEAKICIMGVPFDNAVSLNKGAAKMPGNNEKFICGYVGHNRR